MERITADITEEQLKRKEEIGVNWRFIIEKGLESIEGKKNQNIEYIELMADHRKLMEKFRIVNIRLTNLELENEKKK